jgi:hypothetical protein
MGLRGKVVKNINRDVHIQWALFFHQITKINCSIKKGLFLTQSIAETPKPSHVMACSFHQISMMVEINGSKERR